MQRGELVEYYRLRGGWATARFSHTVERGRYFGSVVVIPTCELNGKSVRVESAYVRPIVKESAATSWWAKRPKTKAKIRRRTNAKVVMVPIEYKESFRRDAERALRDIAGG